MCVAYVYVRVCAVIAIRLRLNETINRCWVFLIHYSLSLSPPLPSPPSSITFEHHIGASDQRHFVTKISPKRIAPYREWFVWMDLLFSSCNKLDEPKRKYRTRCPPNGRFIKNENESKFRVKFSIFCYVWLTYLFVCAFCDEMRVDP